MKKMDLDIVDFHTHILPTQDHGSDSLETTLDCFPPLIFTLINIR